MMSRVSLQLFPSEIGLARSSHSIAWIQDEIYIIGGEIKPREPAAPFMHVCDVRVNTLKPCETAIAPPLRVGAASVVIRGRIYLWGGRGGTAMTPLDEQGTFWIYDPLTSSWSQTPIPSGDIPEPRSYHSLAAINDSIYLHAGCPEKGRLATLHVYSIAENKWTQLPSAPGSPRGGTCFVALSSVLLRFGGFSGEELGESLEVFNPTANQWSSRPFSHGPGNRSVAALVPHPYLSTKVVLLFGEKSPSSDGHNAAGNFWSDIWIYDYPKDTWELAELENAHLLVDGGVGWTAAAVNNKTKEIIVWGGLNNRNERIGNAWKLTLN